MMVRPVLTTSIPQSEPNKMFENFNYESFGFMLFVVISAMVALIFVLIAWQKKAYSKFSDTVYGLLMNYPGSYQPWRAKELWLSGKTPYQAAEIMRAESRRVTDFHR